MKRPTFETLQWKLEDFFTMDQSDYKEAQPYWLTDDTTYGAAQSVSEGKNHRGKGKKKN